MTLRRTMVGGVRLGHRIRYPPSLLSPHRRVPGRPSASEYAHKTTSLLRTYSTDPSSSNPNPPNSSQSSRSSQGRSKSRHAAFYADLLPAWMPIIVIGTAVFLTLQMTRAALAQERFTSEIRGELQGLEKEYRELQALQEEQKQRRAASSAGHAVPGPGEVLAATLPTLVKPVTTLAAEADADGAPVRSGSGAAGTSPSLGASPTKNKGWWGSMFGSK